MTNYEKYKEQIEKITRLGFTFALKKDTKEIVACPGFLCNDCTFNAKFFNGCAEGKLEWADEEYIELEEQEIDWSKIPVDTPILVKRLADGTWLKRHFAKYEDEEVYAWDNGKTSYTIDSISFWPYAKLAEVE